MIMMNIKGILVMLVIEIMLAPAMIEMMMMMMMMMDDNDCNKNDKGDCLSVLQTHNISVVDIEETALAEEKIEQNQVQAKALLAEI